MNCFLCKNRIGLSLALLLLLPSAALAQGEWIHRLDDDHNGFIEPDEISDKYRRIMEVFTVPYKISLSRPNSVKKLEKAAQLYYQQKNSKKSEPTPVVAQENGLKGFAPTSDQRLIPGFGADTIKYPYSQDNLEEAERTLKRLDRDRNGELSPEEVARNRWDSPPITDSDLNKDGYLTLAELAQRYSKRQVVAQHPAMSLGSRLPPAPKQEDPRSRYDRSRAGSLRGGSRGSESLARDVVERYDFNRNGILDPQEMANVGIAISSVDYNRNGTVDDDELGRYLSEALEQQASLLQEAIPTWFFEKDSDGDKQVLMSEFAQEWDQAAIAEFTSYDNNQDGIITINEVLTSQAVLGGKYSSTKAQLLLPRSTVVSEIEVEEDYLIGDLNVQLSISHTYVEQLDGYLIGPDGQRIELFTGVGGSDDHFEKTIFDDDTERRITRERPPFHGHFRPEALDRRQPGLNFYRGKNLKGTWQLMIRGSRSERSGILHGWSLLVQPDQEAIDHPDSVTERLQPSSPEATEGEAKPTGPLPSGTFAQPPGDFPDDRQPSDRSRSFPGRSWRSGDRTRDMNRN